MFRIRFARTLLALAFALFAQTAGAQGIRVYSVSPASVQAGAGSFPIVIRGSNFPKNPVVRLGSAEIETHRIAWDRLRAVVPSQLVASPALSEITVSGRGGRSAAVPFAVTAAPVGNYDWSALTTRLQTYVSNQTPLPADSVRGMTVAIARNGRVIYARGFGNQTIDSVLPIASSTKFPSMLAVMTLVGDGAVDLDAPIGPLLGAYASVPGDKQTITLRMLMNHTSGLPQPTCLNEDTVTLRQCVQQILNAPLLFAPGTQFSYGGGSMHVAGGIVEAVTGQPWNTHFQARIGEPLGLTRFTYGTSPNPRIAGGVSSDAGDYLRLMQAFLAAGLGPSSRIVPPPVFNEMLRDQKRGLPVAFTPVNDADLPGYSYGWWHSSAAYLQAQPGPSTPGPEFSDQGAFGCTPFIDLEHNYAAIILIQRNVATGTAIWNGIRPLIIEQMRANP